VVSQYFKRGHITSGSNYLYTLDHIESIREVTNGSGTIQAQYSYYPYGQKIKIAGVGQEADFQYAGYYFHAPSGLNLSKFRPYKPSLGRWINRDPILENGGTNLYAYVNN